MKQYIKDGQIAGEIVISGDRQIINPSEDILKEEGFTQFTPSMEVEKVDISSPLSNEEIMKLRQEAYKETSDNLFIAHHKYLALGETEKAEEYRLRWLEEVKRIDEMYPYTD